MIGIIPAAGIGSRMGLEIPKQYLRIHERSILDYSIAALLADARIQEVIVALHPDDTLFVSTEAANDPRVHSVIGGTTRAKSVQNALEHAALQAEKNTLVVVHDAARPGLPPDALARLLDQAERDPQRGCVMALPVRDTLKSASSQWHITGTVDRQTVWQAQTPQVFLLEALHHALQHAERAGSQITDESSAIEALGGRPKLVLGSRAAMKVTDPDDLPLVSFYLSQQQQGDL
ncbi:2-C-methyl-D-erythritol 4-phosphate cytidylyltransferase [Aliidiomarina sanyensis]|uniref:2-C-methyl-D-erythritol 4-phosphate cytidylyltransferase n=1 Tax=Aliidiomarina sanyensis TaxID=1249555 RepID=A0A432WRG1_9GAMM|nr:2-C-methyl-D-erythritol 4-phosphate cytidylyltransferase [Aliidiomarina sanyensis]RUO36355.1 2-C-methyl-D-erythritol 4-phosphate cytidylyltransferase [Aliidiomarina sanyensis]